MEEMMVMEETTAVAVVDDAEIAELAEVNGVEVEGEVVTEADGGINPIVAAGVGLGITGIVGGITYMLMRKKKNKKANDKKDETKKAKVPTKPATEAELEEYLGKLAEEMKAANEELIKIKKNKEESEEEKDSEEE